MRIRNSRTPFPPPSPPDPISRSNRLVRFGDCFLVEETNRQIGWSFNPLTISACQVTGEGSCDKLEKGISGEIKPVNCQDEEKGESDCMREKLSQVFGRRYEAQGTEANKGNEPCVTTNKQKDGKASSSAVNFDVARPFASSELAELPLKMKKQTDQLGARDKEEVAIPGKVTEPKKILENDLQDKNRRKRSRTIRGPITGKYSTSIAEGFDGHERPKGMGLEDTATELKEKPKRGRKRKESDQSGDEDWFIEHMQKRSRPKRVNQRRQTTSQFVGTLCTLSLSLFLPLVKLCFVSACMLGV
ncbi:hypothetical protein COLO4_10386 [Corchorus olitorius]|uniref:Uncharacterized protein n=1 Tax=Corchorus olitorius TaxID=93759 RepID=A0A1R3K8R5_9ROSI|nr:hypothetical protein COLO4_10386 [Corchorus olitorius]